LLCSDMLTSSSGGSADSGAGGAGGSGCGCGCGCGCGAKGMGRADGCGGCGDCADHVEEEEELASAPSPLWRRLLISLSTTAMSLGARPEVSHDGAVTRRTSEWDMR
jgi:hypothetical protein